MIVEFDQIYLRDLYVSGRCSDKKHRYQPDIISRYVRVINYLKQAARKEDLYLFASLHFEALQGDRKGLFSVRVNRQYRIEFGLREEGENPILTIANIVELSNHYQ